MAIFWLFDDAIQPEWAGLFEQRLINKVEEMIVTAREDIAAVVAQLNKALDELTDAVTNGTVSEEDLAPLRAAAQALDNVVPDEPAPEPAPEEPPA